MSAHVVAVLASTGVPVRAGHPEPAFPLVPGAYEVVTCAATDERTVATDATSPSPSSTGPRRWSGPTRSSCRRTACGTCRRRSCRRRCAAALARIRPGTRIVSICTGAFALAAVGLLDGRPATTHWALADSFRRMHPRVDLDPEAVLFIDDGDLLTSAGAASGVDVRRTSSAVRPRQRRRHQRRSGTASSSSLARRRPGPAHRAAAPEAAPAAPPAPAPRAGTARTAFEPAGVGRARPDELARTFARRFQEETGTQPRPLADPAAGAPGPAPPESSDRRSTGSPRRSASPRARRRCQHLHRGDRGVQAYRRIVPPGPRRGVTSASPRRPGPSAPGPAATPSPSCRTASASRRAATVNRRRTPSARSASRTA